MLILAHAPSAYSAAELTLLPNRGGGTRFTLHPPSQGSKKTKWSAVLVHLQPSIQTLSGKGDRVGRAGSGGGGGGGDRTKHAWAPRLRSRVLPTPDEGPDKKPSCNSDKRLPSDGTRSRATEETDACVSRAAVRVGVTLNSGQQLVNKDTPPHAVSDTEKKNDLQSPIELRQCCQLQTERATDA
ncbi:unnamed protein product [Ixodes persulcatus]